MKTLDYEQREDAGDSGHYHDVLARFDGPQQYNYVDRVRNNAYNYN